MPADSSSRHRVGPELRSVSRSDSLAAWPRALAFVLALAWLAWRVSEVAKLQSSPGLDLPMNYVYYSMVVGGAYLLLVVLRKIFAR